MEKYDVVVNGVKTTLLLNDEDAKARGLSHKDLASVRIEAESAAAAEAAAKAEAEAAAAAEAAKGTPAPANKAAKATANK